MKPKKQVGILCHLTSLPDPNLGENGALKFCDFLEKMGIGVWQMLPLHPPDRFGSPYSSTSAFAGWRGFLSNSEQSVSKNDFRDFCKINSHWLDDYALFNALKKRFNGKAWTEWPEEFRNREDETMNEVWASEKELIDTIRHQQFQFEQEWGCLRETASSSGIRLFGDIPFFVAHDSADVWASPNHFNLDENGGPTHVSGVPPDYFSPTGQRWGTPLYNWPIHKKDGFRWWIKRMKRMFNLFDIVRIDHFRAIDSAWSIPSHHPTAEHGTWEKGPGDEFLQAIISEIHGEIVAEDLGIIPESVSELRKRHGLPGMAILQFATNEKNNPHRPENHTADTVVYTGTHDNDTTVGWGVKPVDETVIEALNSVSNLAVIPLQDILKLGSEARMNTPGTKDGNWSWQCKWDDLNDANIDWFRTAIKDSGRLN